MAHGRINVIFPGAPCSSALLWRTDGRGMCAVVSPLVVWADPSGCGAGRSHIANVYSLTARRDVHPFDVVLLDAERRYFRPGCDHDEVEAAGMAGKFEV
jgi:hypothetical protein